MQHLGVNKEMHLALREVLKKLPLEDRLSTVEDLPAEVRLRGLPTEERLKGLPAEEILRGLTPEELDRLRKLLQQPTVVNSGGE